MVKVEIEVDQVLTSAVALECEPGDKVLVMNGVIIGMVEGRHPRRPVEVKAPAPAAPKRDPERLVSRGDRAVEQRVVALLKDAPLTAGKIAQRLRAENGGRRLMIRELLIGMRGRGVIEAVNRDRFPPYRLVPEHIAVIGAALNGAG